MSLTKREMAVSIAEKTALTQNEVAQVIQLTLDTIADALAKGKNIELRNFGVFEIRVRKSRKGRNPNNPTKEIPIPERAVVKFRAGKELKANVEKLSTKKASATKKATPAKAKAPAKKATPAKKTTKKK